jgi:hypothetical protein
MRLLKKFTSEIKCTYEYRRLIDVVRLNSQHKTALLPVQPTAKRLLICILVQKIY